MSESSSSFLSEPSGAEIDYLEERVNLQKDLALGHYYVGSDEEDISDVRVGDADIVAPQGSVNRYFMASHKYHGDLRPNYQVLEDINAAAEYASSSLMYMMRNVQQVGERNSKRTALAFRQKRRSEMIERAYAAESIRNTGLAYMQDDEPVIDIPEASGVKNEQAMQSYPVERSGAPIVIKRSAVASPAANLTVDRADCGSQSQQLPVSEVAPDIKMQRDKPVREAQQTYLPKYEIFLVYYDFTRASIQQVDHSVLDRPRELSSDASRRNIASYSNGNLVMFVSHVEPLQNEAEAVAWGRVLVYESKSDIQNLRDPLKSQTQDSCVFISGIQREQWALPAEALETRFMRYIAQWNEVFKQNGVYDEKTRSYSDAIVSDSYNVERCNALCESLRAYVATAVGATQVEVDVTPCWRVYHFSDPSVPREPRVWLRIRYPANYAPMQPRAFIAATGGLFTHIIGHTVRPLELFLAQRYVPAANWVVFSGVSEAYYVKRNEIVKQLEKTGGACFKEFLAGAADYGTLLQLRELYKYLQKPPQEIYDAVLREISDLVQRLRDTAFAPPKMAGEVYGVYDLVARLKQEMQPRLLHDMSQRLQYLTQSVYDALRRYAAALRECSRSLVYHEFSLDLRVPGTNVGALREQDVPLPCLSACYVSVRKVQSAGSEEPLILTLTYTPRVSLAQNLFGYESNSQTFVFARPLRKQMPFLAQTMAVKLEHIGFESQERYNSVNVKLVAAENEMELYLAFFRVLGELNPDIVVSDELFADFANILRRAAKAYYWAAAGAQMTRSVCKLLRPHLDALWILNAKSDYHEHVKYLFKGRVLVELQTEIREFSPDDRQTDIEYTLQALIGAELARTPGFQLMELYASPRNFKDQLLAELLRENYTIIKIVRELSVLQLTSKIAQLTGFQWNQIFTYGRARRVESLLFRTFAVLPFVLPDYQEEQESDGKPKYVGGFVLEPIPGLYDSVIVVLDFNSLYPSIIREYDVCFTTVRPKEECTYKYEETHQNEAQMSNTYIDEIAELKGFDFALQLPHVVAELIRYRYAIKRLIKEKNARLRGAGRDERPLLQQELQQLEVHYLALKLCANSMYGSLGYSRARFYAPRVAAAIPALGRDELQSAVSIARGLGYDVVYGDTDSIMVDTRLRYGNLQQDVHGTTANGGAGPGAAARREIEAITAAASRVAEEISYRVGAGKRFLELGLDYVYVKQLLLAKKKYAALRITTDSYLKIEVKGLDMVRRDWCGLARTLSGSALEALLWRPRAEASEAVLALCRAFKDALARGALDLSQFKMTKALSKLLADYTAYNAAMPHVTVARMLQRRGRDVSRGYIVYYLVLSAAAASAAQAVEKNAKTLATVPPHQKENYEGIEAEQNDYQKAQIDDVEAAGVAARCIPYEDYERLFGRRSVAQVLDMDFYIYAQALPPLSRLCSFIPELSASYLGAALGVEVRQPVEASLPGRTLVSNDIRERYANCAPFVYQCACGCIRTWPETIQQEGQPLSAFSVDLDEQSRAYRYKPAHDDSLLHFDDFLKVPCRCGALVDFESMWRCLQRYLTYYRRLYFSLPRFCSNTKCSAHRTPLSVLQMRLGALGFDFQMPRGGIETPDCLFGDCRGELYLLYPVAMYRTQLHFFADLFNPDHAFYRSARTRLLEGYDFFAKVHTAYMDYLDRYDVMRVDLRAAMRGVNW